MTTNEKPAWLEGISIHPSAYERFTEKEINSGLIDVRLLINPPATKSIGIDIDDILDSASPRDVFEFFAQYEPKLKRLEKSIMNLKKTNFRKKGEQRLEGNSAENGWIGYGNFKGIEEQLEEAAGPYSDTPWKELREEDVYFAIHKHVSYLYNRRENFPYIVEGMTPWNYMTFGEWQPEWAGI